MDIVEKENNESRRRWVGVISLAVVGLVAGAFLGFISKAVEPVQEFAKLPPREGKDAKKLPKVYWLRQYTASGIGAPREKELAVRESRPVGINDREMGLWFNRTFGTSEVPKEDLDAVAGAAFVRVGGQAPGAEKEEVLTVTMPFKLKVFSLPVSDVNFQFVARPAIFAGETHWDVSQVRVGHARIPSFIASSMVPDVVTRYMKSTESGAKMLKSLSLYRRVAVHDGQLWLSAPSVVPAAR